MNPLEDDILLWVDETRSILVSMKRIVEYFGDEAEYQSLLSSLKLPEIFFEGVVPAFRNHLWRADTRGIQPSGFTCKRTVATMITPLLQLIVEPVPDFVPRARRELDPTHFKSLMRHVGGFTGSISVDLCKPLWRSFPELTPDEGPGSQASVRLDAENGPGDDPM